MTKESINYELEHGYCTKDEVYEENLGVSKGDMLDFHLSKNIDTKGHYDYCE